MLETIKNLVSRPTFTTLEQIRENAKIIHSDRILFPYTDHGVAHSDRVLRNLTQLFPSLFNDKNRQQLSQSEVFCLVAAIYLHDIGIQLNRNDSLLAYCKKMEIAEIDFSDQNAKGLFVRKQHHSISKFWVLDSIATRSSFSPSSSYVGDKGLAPYVANICESHGIDFEDHNEYTDTDGYEGNEIRMGLLCTLLSLGDALDCDKQRIIYDKLNNQDVPLDSKIHWMKHYYVDSINVKNGYLKLFYHFPKCANPADQEVYQYYFCHQTKYWIEKCKEIRGKFRLFAISSG